MPLVFIIQFNNIVAPNKDYYRKQYSRINKNKNDNVKGILRFALDLLNKPSLREDEVLMKMWSGLMKEVRTRITNKLGYESRCQST